MKDKKKDKKKNKMKDPQLDQIHALVAKRKYGGLPTAREQDLRNEVLKRYTPLIEKMAEAHLFSYYLYVSDPDGKPCEYAEIDACGAWHDDGRDEEHIAICGHGTQIDGGWFHEKAEQPKGDLLHQVIESYYASRCPK